MSLLEWFDSSFKGNEELEQRNKRLCMHVKNALTTASGNVLRQWLREACAMNDVTSEIALSDPLLMARINGKRDVYITLEHLLEGGLEYARSDSATPIAE